MAYSNPKEDILALFDLLRMPKTEDLVGATQELWLQKNLERWHYKDIFSEKREQALPLLSKIGCVDEIAPQKMKYDYALLLGGLQSRVEERLNFLIDQWNRGVRFSSLVFLTGQRPLEKGKEPLADLVSNETEMMREVFKRSHVPEEMKKIKLVIIDTPQPAPGKRPNTMGTIQAWLLTKPNPGACLAVSNQPFAMYQDSVLKTYLPDTFEVETIATKAKDNLLLAHYLDSLARYLYQEKIRLGS